jgi:hypothetical protein
MQSQKPTFRLGERKSYDATSPVVPAEANYEGVVRDPHPYRSGL